MRRKMLGPKMQSSRKEAIFGAGKLSGQAADACPACPGSAWRKTPAAHRFLPWYVEVFMGGMWVYVRRMPCHFKSRNIMSCHITRRHIMQRYAISLDVAMCCGMAWLKYAISGNTLRRTSYSTLRGTPPHASPAHCESNKASGSSNPTSVAVVTHVATTTGSSVAVSLYIHIYICIYIYTYT